MAAPSDPPPPSLAGADWLARARRRRPCSPRSPPQGFAARAVGGAVRNALLGRPVVDVDIATPARPEQVIAAAEAAGLTAVPTGIAHGTVTVIAEPRALRGHDAARGRRDARPPRHRRLHRRLGGRRAPARLHHQRALLQRRRRGVRPARRLSPISRRAACASSAMPASASARTTCASCASSGSRPSMAKGPPDADGLAACVLEREGSGASCRPSACARSCCACWRRRAGRSSSRAMQDYGLLALGAACRAAAASARPTGRHRRRRSALDAGCDSAARRAGGRDAGGRRSPARPSAPLQRGACRLGAGGHARPRAIGPGAPEAAARACLYAEGATAYREPRADRLGAVGRRARRASPGATRFALPERWQPPRFPLGGADVMALGVPAGPRVGELLRALEAWWIAGDFAADEAALRVRLGELARS